MDAVKVKYAKQGETKVYNCTYELELFELRIFLRFPCKFFVEWKTNPCHKIVKTQGLVQNFNGKVLFNQKLTLQIEMLYDVTKTTWVRKDSTISVYLITKNKPDFNQLVGRVNIDLSSVFENNPYQKPTTEALTYSSASADLKFSLDMKYHLMSKKTLSEVDLHNYKYIFTHFSEKVSSSRQSQLLSKSKSNQVFKNMQQVASPVYQMGQSPKTIASNSKQVKPFHFPVSKLQIYGRQTHEILRQSDGESSESALKMTLGKDKNPLAKREYDQMIEEQSKGTKKSNLMMVPDMKKSAQQDAFQFLTENSKRTLEDRQKLNDLTGNTPTKKVGSLQILNKPSIPESEIDIVCHLQQLSEKPGPKDNQNSLSSSNSFSISRFKAQFQASGKQAYSSNKQGFDPIASIQIPITLKKHMSSNDAGENIESVTQKYEAGKNRIKELESDISQLVKMLTDTREKAVILQNENEKTLKLLENLTYENAELQKKLDELEQKSNYESRINEINCQKLKKVSSQLTEEKRRISKSHDQFPQIISVTTEIKSLKETLKKISFQKASLEEKLFRRDEIELQNEIRIQELQQELQKYRTQKLNSAPKTSPSALQIESKIDKGQKNNESQIKQKEYIKNLEEKVEAIEKENIKVKDMCNEAFKSIDMYHERDQRMKNFVFIAEKQFQSVAKLLLQKERVLKEKMLEIENLKKRSPASAFSPSTAQQIKFKALEEELKNKVQALEFFEGQIHILEEELNKVQLQNKELKESGKGSFRESIKFEGDLKVIKEEDTYRESMASSSGDVMKNPFPSTKLTVKEESVLAKYKYALKTYFEKENASESANIEFTAETQDLRKKAFEELDRSAKIIAILMDKIERIQARLDQIEDQQKGSAGSSNITPISVPYSYKPSEQEIGDQLSQATKKRSTLPMNNEARLSREVEKLKSLLYDKSKEMNDIISSYEKLRLEKQTQAMLMKAKKVTIMRPSIANSEESDTELVHDLLDLQIRLNKEKEHKSQIMSELSIQKSLNKSQEISNYTQCDIGEVYKEIRSVILSRENFITTEESLNRFIARINTLEKAVERVEKDSKLMYVVEEKARSISKELQVMKSALFKMNFKEIQPYQYKTTFAAILKPCQNVLNELLASVQQMVNEYA